MAQQIKRKESDNPTANGGSQKKACRIRTIGLSPQRGREYAAILNVVTSTLMPIDVDLVAGLPVLPLLELISGYAIDRSVTTIDSLPISRSLVVSDGCGGIWTYEHELFLSGNLWKWRYLNHLHLTTGQKQRVLITPESCSWVKSVYVDVSRSRVYTLNILTEYNIIRMVENGKVSDIIEKADCVTAMVFSPLGSSDGSLILSKSVYDPPLMRLSITERKMEVLIDAQVGNMCWDRSSTSEPYTELYCEIRVSHDHLKLSRINLKTKQIMDVIKEFKTPFGMVFDCMVNGIIIIGAHEHIFSFDPLTGILKTIAGGGPMGSSDGDPLSEAYFECISSISYLESEWSVVVSDNSGRIRKVPLPIELCLPTLPNT